MNYVPEYFDPICFITSQICAAISRVGASITTCKPLFRLIFSRAMTANTAVFPVPDLASSSKSKTKNYFDNMHDTGDLRIFR